MTDDTTESADKRVMLVMRQRGNAEVLVQAVGEIGMTGVTISNEEALREELGRDTPAGSALIDVSGFGRDVWDLCQLLKEHEVPFVVLSPRDNQQLGNRSIECGATSVLQKPITKAALLQLMRNLHGS